MSNRVRKILQLIPADPGWHVAELDSRGIDTSPVVCFALCVMCCDEDDDCEPDTPPQQDAKDLERGYTWQQILPVEAWDLEPRATREGDLVAPGYEAVRLMSEGHPYLRVRRIGGR